MKFEIPNWVGQSFKIGVPVAILLAGGVARGSPKMFSTGETLTADALNLNFKDLDTRINAMPIVLAASAERTGSIPPNTSTWTTIPGLKVTLNLAQSSLVQATGNGTQRTTDAFVNTVCHLELRYVVDGVAKGDPVYGQRINVSNGANSWHAGWSAIDFNTLGAGSHTIELQAKNDDPGHGDCYVCAELDGGMSAYDSCTLNVIAVPQ